jgi:hypothetical protein
MLGIDLRKTVVFARGLPWYMRDYLAMRRQRQLSTLKFALGKPYPCLGERAGDSGSARGHYFHQDLLVASRIFANKPDVHLDVGSRIDGFVAHVASFREIQVVDIRPLVSRIPNVVFRQADFMSPLPADLLACCDSLSCLHAIEHFGLGRYGDPVRYDGYIRGLDNLYRTLKPSGKLYLSAPIGPQRIEFNAHRIFSVAHLMECCAGRFRIDRFSFVDDEGLLHDDVPLEEERVRDSFGCTHGCGIFEMTKLDPA